MAMKDASSRSPSVMLTAVERTYVVDAGISRFCHKISDGLRGQTERERRHYARVAIRTKGAEDRMGSDPHSGAFVTVRRWPRRRSGSGWSQ